MGLLRLGLGLTASFASASTAAVCGDQCSATAGQDAVSRGIIVPPAQNSTVASCCEACKANPRCEAFVTGPCAGHSSATDPVCRLWPDPNATACFLVDGFEGLKPASNRTSTGCVRTKKPARPKLMGPPRNRTPEVVAIAGTAAVLAGVLLAAATYVAAGKNGCKCAEPLAFGSLCFQNVLDTAACLGFLAYGLWLMAEHGAYPVVLRPVFGLAVGEGFLPVGYTRWVYAVSYRERQRLW
jgi:hypothetical protein